MKHINLTDDVKELAALYALGTLHPAEASAFEEHLKGGCGLCAQEVQAYGEVVMHLAAAAPPAAPPAELRGRVFASIASGELVVRSDEVGWEPGGIEGLYKKRFHSDPEERRYVALVRMDGPRHYAEHRHGGAAEELYVLEGSLSVGGCPLEAGDYYAAPAGNVHDISGGPEGCVCIILSPEVDDPAGETDRGAPLHVLRSGQEPWRDGGIQGLRFRPLYRDRQRGTTTALVRMEGGSELPRHRHALAEQFVMLEGDALVEGRRLRAGDYYRIGAGTVHEVTRTKAGCTFLLLASRMPVAA